MPRTVTLNADTLDNITEADLAGTPIRKKDMHGFAIAAAFSKIPQKEWERLLPEMENCELTNFSASFYQWGARNLLGVTIDYTVIDRKNGEYRRVCENFGKKANEPVDGFFSTMNRDDIVSSRQLFKKEYPFTNEIIADYMSIFNHGFPEADKCAEDGVDTMWGYSLWASRRKFFEKIVLPCIQDKSLEERRDIIIKSKVLQAPCDISWKMWLLDQIIAREDLRPMLSRYALASLDRLEAEESQTTLMKM